MEISSSASKPSSNFLYLGDNPADLKARMHPNQTSATAFKWPRDRLLQLRVTIGVAEMKNPQALDENGEATLVVMKRGRSSGLTVGRANTVESRRRTVARGVTKISREWCILGEGRNIAFSQKGDSGAIIVDGTGRIGGLLTGGDGTWVDITYATPFEWILQRIKALLGEEVHLA